MMSPDQLLKCRIQPHDRPIIALDTQILLDAALGRDLDSYKLVKKVGDMSGRQEVIVLETADALDEFRHRKNKWTETPGSLCNLKLVDSILNRATLITFPQERCEWDDVLPNLGKINVQHFRLVADGPAEILATKDRRLLRANKDHLQQDPGLGRITTAANCLQFLNTLDLLFQLNQGV
jgi:hypothetical protein